MYDKLFKALEASLKRESRICYGLIFEPAVYIITSLKHNKLCLMVVLEPNPNMHYVSTAWPLDELFEVESYIPDA